MQTFCRVLEARKIRVVLVVDTIDHAAEVGRDLGEICNEVTTDFGNRRASLRDQ